MNEEETSWGTSCPGDDNREAAIRRWSKIELKMVIYEVVYMIYYYMCDVDPRCEAFLNKWLPMVVREEVTWQHLKEINPNLSNVQTLGEELKNDGELFRKVGMEMGLDGETINLFKEMQEIMKVINPRTG